jgi:hypothetical protein
MRHLVLGFQIRAMESNAVCADSEKRLRVCSGCLKKHFTDSLSDNR